MESSPNNTNLKEDSSRYLVFSAGEETYAIPLLSVREVVAYPKTTPIPYTPPHFVGLMNLRGQVLSVVDLVTKLGVKSNTKVPDEERVVIIVDIGHVQIGVIVDGVNTVLALNKSDISPPPILESKRSTDFITGIHRNEDKGLCVLIDIAKVIDVQDLKHIKNQDKAS